MKSWIKTSLFALVAAAILLPASAWARPGGPGGHRHGGGPGQQRFLSLLEENAERLGIDASTLERAREIEQETRESRSDLHSALRQERRTMRELLAAPAPNEAAVMQQADVIAKLDGEIHKQRLRTLIQLRGLLTPEQISELGEIQRERRETRRQRRRRLRRGMGGFPPQDHTGEPDTEAAAPR